MKIINNSNQSVICTECKVAKTFMSRFLGLMGRKDIPMGSGLIIVPCNSIHMFFMKIPLDVIFIDKNNIILHVIEDIQPWKVSPIIRNAHSVIELPAGTVKASGTVKGDRLELA